MPPSDDSLPPAGQTLRLAFEALVETLNARDVRYAIIGGIAVIQHTRVRTTDDIDALLTVPQLEMPALFEALRDRGFTVDVRQHIRELRDDGLTCIRFKDVLVDLMTPLIPTYAHVLDRAITASVLGHQVRIGSAEGLILTKLIAMRPHDEQDIKDLLAAYGDDLDLAFIHAELDLVMEADDSRRIRFDSWVREATAPNDPE